MSGSSEGVAIKKSARPLLTTGVALITAVALTFVPSVKDSQQSARPAQTTSAAQIATAPIQLAAAVQPLATTTLPSLLVEWVDRIVVPPSASAPFPTPQFPPVVGGTSVSSFIKNTYNAIEPWVQWGFELVAYGVGWVPYVGWLAPQIMIFYNLGERIVRSITFNIADWIGGQVSFAQGLINVGVDTINSFIFFANDQLAFWLPPLPPIPPIGPFAAAETAELTESTDSMAMTSAEIPGKAALDVVEGEEAIVETDVVDAAATEDETEQIETERAVNEATLEEEPVIEDIEDEAEEESTTSSSGTVQAHGEVRETGTNASPDETTDNATDSSPNNDTPDVTANPTDAAPANDDSGPEKRVSSPDSGGATSPGRAAASPAQ